VGRLSHLLIDRLILGLLTRWIDSNEFDPAAARDMPSAWSTFFDEVFQCETVKTWVGLRWVTCAWSRWGNLGRSASFPAERIWI